MLPIPVINELQKSLPYIIPAYGGLENFILNIKEFLDIPPLASRRALSKSQYQSLITYTHAVLKYEDDIIMVSPWAMFVDLRDLEVSGVTTVNGINTNEPYRIYDMKGNLKYSVVGHQGAFGESRLDKFLINNSINASIYYLKYTTYAGTEKIKLLIVNLYSREIRTSNQLFKSPAAPSTSSLTIANRTLQQGDVYIIVAPPNLHGTGFSFTAAEYALPIQSESVETQQLINGAYLYFDTTINPYTPVRTSTVSTSDIVILVETSATHTLYYLGINVDPALLNKTFGTNIAFSNRAVTEIFELQ